MSSVSTGHWQETVKLTDAQMEWSNYNTCSVRCICVLHLHIHQLYSAINMNFYMTKDVQVMGKAVVSGLWGGRRGCEHLLSGQMAGNFIDIG